MNETEARDILVTEYKVITQQFIHWDDFFWAKARFFLAAEGVAILTTAGWLIDTVRSLEKAASLGHLREYLFVLLLAIVTLNLFLCRVWYLTGARNRQFLYRSAERAREIELHPLLQYGPDADKGPLVRIFYDQESKLRAIASGKGSSFWERRIPSAFASLWCVLLLAGLWLLQERWYYGLAGAIIIEGALYSVMTLYPKRSLERDEGPDK